MKVNLVVERGRTSVSKITLRKLPTTVGRHRSCRLQITSRQVSREHCVFDEQEGLLTVRDLGSSNGTLVNGQRVTMETVLEPGDRVEIGPVLFRVDYEPTEMMTVVAPEDFTMEDTDEPTASADEAELISDQTQLEPIIEPFSFDLDEPELQEDEEEGPEQEEQEIEHRTIFETLPTDDSAKNLHDHTVFEPPKEEMKTMAELFQTSPEPEDLNGPPTFLDDLSGEGHDSQITLFEQTDDDK